MSYRITLLPEARENFATIFTWLASWSPQGANTWFNRFSEVLLTLEDAPLSFGLAPESELATREVRQLIFKTKRGQRYRTLFTVSGDTVSCAARSWSWTRLRRATRALTNLRTSWRP